MPVDPRTEYSTVCVTRDVSYYFLFLISQLSTAALLSLSLVSLCSFDLSDEIDVLGYSFLGPDAAAQRHDCDLQEDLELRCQTAVNARCG